jgi:hypothetical protein
MEERLTAKERAAIITFALLANVVFFGLLFVLEAKWFKFIGWTGLVFGVVLYACWHGLKRIRSLLVFAALLTAHVALCAAYLRSATRFPILFFAFFAPFEAAIAVFIMTTVGGVRPRPLRHRKSRPGGEFWTNRNDKGKRSRL